MAHCRMIRQVALQVNQRFCLLGLLHFYTNCINFRAMTALLESACGEHLRHKKRVDVLALVDDVKLQQTAQPDSDSYTCAVVQLYIASSRKLKYTSRQHRFAIKADIQFSADDSVGSPEGLVLPGSRFQDDGPKITAFPWHRICTAAAPKSDWRWIQKFGFLETSVLVCLCKSSLVPAVRCTLCRMKNEG